MFGDRSDPPNASISWLKSRSEMGFIVRGAERMKAARLRGRRPPAEQNRNDLTFLHQCHRKCPALCKLNVHMERKKVRQRNDVDGVDDDDDDDDDNIDEDYDNYDNYDNYDTIAMTNDMHANELCIMSNDDDDDDDDGKR